MVNWIKAKTIEATVPFISKVRIADVAIQDFFLKVLQQFKNELQLVADHWYNYEKGIDDNSGTEDVFALIERSYVGVFNNAVLRCFPTDPVLQEFSVHLEDKKYGRCDLLIKHLFNDKSINLLFELKHRVFDGRDFTGTKMKSILQPLTDQGRKYYDAEKDYYKGDTYIVSLIFVWVRRTEFRKQVLEWKETIDDGTRDFFCFYHTDLAGLFIQGNLEKQPSTIDINIRPADHEQQTTNP